METMTDADTRSRRRACDAGGALWDARNTLHRLLSAQLAKANCQSIASFVDSLGIDIDSKYEQVVQSGDLDKFDLPLLCKLLRSAPLLEANVKKAVKTIHRVRNSACHSGKYDLHDVELNKLIVAIATVGGAPPSLPLLAAPVPADERSHASESTATATATTTPTPTTDSRSARRIELDPFVNNSLSFRRFADSPVSLNETHRYSSMAWNNIDRARRSTATALPPTRASTSTPVFFRYLLVCIAFVLIIHMLGWLSRLAYSWFACDRKYCTWLWGCAEQSTACVWLERFAS
jgi:hypothetical protein